MGLIARYAVAESRYRQFIDQESATDEPQVRPAISELLRYLPSLAVLGNCGPSRDELFLFGGRLLFFMMVPDIPERVGYELNGARNGVLSFFFCM